LGVHSVLTHPYSHSHFILLAFIHFIHSFHLIPFIHALHYSFIRSFIPFIHSLHYSFNRSFTHSFVHSFIQSSHFMFSMLLRSLIDSPWSYRRCYLLPSSAFHWLPLVPPFGGALWPHWHCQGQSHPYSNSHVRPATAPRRTLLGVSPTLGEALSCLAFRPLACPLSFWLSCVFARLLRVVLRRHVCHALALRSSSCRVVVAALPNFVSSSFCMGWLRLPPFYINRSLLLLLPLPLLHVWP
jgi:hypothetical protein